MNDNQAAVIIEAPGQHQASIIWLHGLGANGHDFEPIVPELRLPADHGIRFIFPHAPERAVTINGGMVMPAWYDIKEMDLRRREDAPGIEESRQIVEQLISTEKAAGIKSEKILLAGFSQGGVVILHSGLRHSEPLAGLIALSTYLAVPDQMAAQAHSANSDVAILMAHGVDDPIIPIEQGRNSRDQLEAAGYSVAWHEYAMQHSVSLEEIETIGSWISERLL